MVQAEQADAVLVVGVFDGLPPRVILLVRGVRARRGGVAREGDARTNGTLAAARSFGAVQTVRIFALLPKPVTRHAKTSDVRIGTLGNGSSGGLSNLPRPVNLRSRRPGPPAPAQAGTRGAISRTRTATRGGCFRTVSNTIGRDKRVVLLEC